MEIEKIIEQVGGVRATAELSGVSVQAVYNWKKVPAPHVLKISKKIGVDPFDLRPDVFPDPAEVA